MLRRAVTFSCMLRGQSRMREPGAFSQTVLLSGHLSVSASGSHQSSSARFLMTSQYLVRNERLVQFGLHAFPQDVCPFGWWCERWCVVGVGMNFFGHWARQAYEVQVAADYAEGPCHGVGRWVLCFMRGVCLQFFWQVCCCQVYATRGLP